MQMLEHDRNFPRGLRVRNEVVNWPKIAQKVSEIGYL